MLLKKQQQHHHHQQHNPTQSSATKMNYKKSYCCCYCSSSTNSNSNNNKMLDDYHKQHSHNQFNLSNNYKHDRTHLSTNLNSSFMVSSSSSSSSSSPLKLYTKQTQINPSLTSSAASLAINSLSKRLHHQSTTTTQSQQNYRQSFLLNNSSSSGSNYSPSTSSINSSNNNGKLLNANQSIEGDHYNYFYLQRQNQPCIIQHRSHSKSKPANSSSNIQKLVKLDLVKSRNSNTSNNRLVPSSSGVDLNRSTNTSHHSSTTHNNNTQNYLIKYPNTPVILPSSKSSASIRSLYFNSNNNNNSNVQFSNTKQEVNVYDEIITSDQEDNICQSRSNLSRKNSTNDYELLSNLNSSINSNNTSLNSSCNLHKSRSSMICMNNNRINSITSCSNNLHNKITSTINCFKSFGQNTQKEREVLNTTQNKSYANSAIRSHHVSTTTSTVMVPPVPPSLPPPKLKHQPLNLTDGSQSYSNKTNSNINSSNKNNKIPVQYDSSPTSDHCDSILSSSSSCSSSISSSKSIFFAKINNNNTPLSQTAKKSKSPVTSSGYNSSQDQESSFFTNSSYNKGRSNNSNYNSTILSYVGLSSREYLSPNKKTKTIRASDDSGVSTMHEHLGKDYYEHGNDSTSSNISSFLSNDTSHLEEDSSSSVSLSCASNNSSGFYNGAGLKSEYSFDESNPQTVEYMHMPSFPRVKTCLIAQIKHLDSNGNSIEKKKTRNAINEPLYENLTVESMPKKKNYSVHDILQSLNSLEFQNNTSKNSKKIHNKRLSAVNTVADEDLLCDEEVQFYLNRVENCSSLSEQHHYQFADTDQDLSVGNQSNIEATTTANTQKSFNSKFIKNNTLKINRPIAFWEQLV